MTEQASLFTVPLDTTVTFVALARIQPGEARETIPSVRLMGVLQPVLLRPSQGGYDFALVDGGRRDHSARVFGLTEIPAIITDGTPAQLAAARAVLNTSRGPNPVQEARAWHEALASGVYPSAEALCRDLGVNVGTVRARLRLVALPDQLLDGVLTGSVSEGVAAKIANLAPPYQERALARYAELLAEGGRFTGHDLKEVRARREGDLSRTVLTALASLPGQGPLLHLSPASQLAADVRRLAGERGVPLADLAMALGFGQHLAPAMPAPDPARPTLTLMPAPEGRVRLNAR